MEDISSTNPTLPFIVASIGGNEYKLCFTFGAILRAQQDIAKVYPEVNLLAAKWRALTVTSLAALFTAGLHEFHPEITADAALVLIDQSMDADPFYVVGLINSTYRAWISNEIRKDEAEASKGDPQTLTEEQTT